jgi:hypothetical protein
MLRIFILLAAIVAVGFAGDLRAQDAGGDRAKALATALDKEKYKKKEKKNITVEVYVNVTNEVAVKTDPAAYSGVYESEGYKLDLRVSPSGDAAGSGHDSPSGDGKAVKFELRDGRVDGAVLTGVKVYESGDKRKFEAVFVNRTAVSGTNKDKIDSRETVFGLGFLESGPVIADHMGSSAKMTGWTNRVFLERKN